MVGEKNGSFPILFHMAWGPEDLRLTSFPDLLHFYTNFCLALTLFKKFPFLLKVPGSARDSIKNGDDLRERWIGWKEWQKSKGEYENSMPKWEKRKRIGGMEKEQVKSEASRKIERERGTLGNASAKRRFSRSGEMDIGFGLSAIEWKTQDLNRE